MEKSDFLIKTIKETLWQYTFFNDLYFHFNKHSVNIQIKKLSIESSDLKISNGRDATLEYERFLLEKHEVERKMIKKELLKYNQDDLKKTKFIYDILKKRV